MTKPLNSQKAISSIKLVIDSRLENVRLLGLAVQAFCVYLNFDETEAFQTQLALVEGVTNIIRHAYDGQPGREVEVTITLYPQCLSFQIIDTGQPLPALNLKALEFDPSDVSHLPEGGMGMVIMHHVMDRVEYRRIGESNILTMDKCFPSTRRPGPSS